MIVLDDLHAADTPSLLLLQFLARELGSTRVLLLGAFRDVDPIPRQAAYGDADRGRARAGHPSFAACGAERARCEGVRRADRFGDRLCGVGRSTPRGDRRKSALRVRGAAPAHAGRHPAGVARSQNRHPSERPRRHRPPAHSPLRRVQPRPGSGVRPRTGVRARGGRSCRRRLRRSTARAARRGDGRPRRLRRSGWPRSSSLRPRPHPRHALRGSHDRASSPAAQAGRRGARGALRCRTGTPHGRARVPLDRRRRLRQGRRLRPARRRSCLRAPRLRGGRTAVRERRRGARPLGPV